MGKIILTCTLTGNNLKIWSRLIVKRRPFQESQGM